MRSWALLGTGIIIVAMQGISGSVHGTSFLERPFEESVKDSPLIVRGKIGSSSTDWGAERDGGKRIFTYWDLEVSETLKGAIEPRNGSIRIREMGGEKDGVGMQVSGAASFSAGEDTVVFLGERNSDGTHDVWGMMMGKYSLRKDAGGQEVLEGAGLTGDSHGHSGSKGAKPTQAWTIPALRKLVAQQGDSPAPRAAVASQIPPKSSATPSVSSPAPSETAAPRLHDSTFKEPPESGAFGAIGWALGAAVVLGAIGYFALRKSR